MMDGDLFTSTQVIPPVETSDYYLDLHQQEAVLSKCLELSKMNFNHNNLGSFPEDFCRFQRLRRPSKSEKQATTVDTNGESCITPVISKRRQENQLCPGAPRKPRRFIRLNQDSNFQPRKLDFSDYDDR